MEDEAVAPTMQSMTRHLEDAHRGIRSSLPPFMMEIPKSSC